VTPRLADAFDRIDAALSRLEAAAEGRSRSAGADHGRMTSELRDLRGKNAALQAEARLKSLETTGVKGVVSPERVQFLERENAGLTKRLATARDRTQQMIDRVRFLRQQHDGAAAR